jgi:hypothetical protein
LQPHSIPDSIVNDSVYSIYRCDRKLGHRQTGGGVLALVSKQLKVIEVNINLDFHYSKHFCEIISFDVYSHHERFRIFVVYRPPSTSYLETEALCNHLSSFLLPCNNLIVGDLNCPRIKWDYSITPSDRPQKSFQEFCISKSLRQLVEFPTRTHASTKTENILDILLTD